MPDSRPQARAKLQSLDTTATRRNSAARKRAFTAPRRQPLRRSAPRCVPPTPPAAGALTLPAPMTVRSLPLALSFPIFLFPSVSWISLSPSFSLSLSLSLFHLSFISIYFLPLSFSFSLSFSHSSFLPLSFCRSPSPFDEAPADQRSFSVTRCQPPHSVSVSLIND